jgi:predicted phage-related endonuclease
MTVTVYTPTSREDWLAGRMGTIGASEAAALLGEHPYMSPYALWMTKTGRAPPVVETPAMRRGRLLEPVAVEAIHELHPDWQLTPNSIPGGSVWRDDKLRLSCTPDLHAEIPGRDGRTSIQIKSVSPDAFNNGWINHVRDGDDPEWSPPVYAMIQATIEARLTGAASAMVAALVVDHGVDLYLADVPLNVGIWERIVKEAAEFWSLVDTGREPDPDLPRDNPLVVQRYRETTPGLELDLSQSNEVAILINERREVNQQLSAAKKRGDDINAKLLVHFADAELIKVAGGTVTAKTIVRKAYSVPESRYRNIKYREDQQP